MAAAGRRPPPSPRRFRRSLPSTISHSSSLPAAMTVETVPVVVLSTSRLATKRRSCGGEIIWDVLKIANINVFT